MTENLTANERFFYDHAGFSWPLDTDPAVARVANAKLLAEAERWAIDETVTFVWRDDVHDDGLRVPETCESCSAVNEDGVVLASLGCIDDADDDYRRVVAGELAEVARAVVVQGLV